MSKVVDVYKLSRDQLIEALSFTTANDEALRRVREYYSLLPTDELRARAEGIELRAPDVVPRKKPVAVIKEEKPIVLPRERARSYKNSALDDCRAHLQLCSWVVDVVDITTGVLGVALHIDDVEKLGHVARLFPTVTLLKKIV